MKTGANRRGFFRSLVSGAAAVGAGALPGFSAGSAGQDISGHYDIIVCGGGPGGVCSAVAAARAGKKVLLIERYGFLGGMATAGLVQPFMPYKTGDRIVNAGIFAEVQQALKGMGAYGSEIHEDVFDSEILKIIELDLCRKAGVNILFHSFVFRATVRKKRVAAVHVANKAGEMKFSADVFIDSTGDGDLAFHAGADWELGRDSDGYTQPATIFFKMNGVDLEKTMKYVDSGRDDIVFSGITEKARKTGEFTSPREDTLWFCTPRDGQVSFNTTRLLKYDATDPRAFSAMEMEGLDQVRDTAAYARKYLPGFEKAYIGQIASQVGVRESRRIVCDYRLIQDDLLSCREFEDGIARGCWSIDIHNPDGRGTYKIGIPAGQAYTIPYRSLTVRGFDNLLMGCRAICGTHEAHSAYRVQPIVMSIGHAAGLAASLALENSGDVRGIDTGELREKLANQGAVI